MGAPPNVLGNREMKGPTYRMLRPEVKQTLDKLIYQLDLCRNTLTLLENRITINESRLSEVVDYIKAEDFSYVSHESILMFILASNDRQGGDKDNSRNGLERLPRPSQRTFKLCWRS